MSRWRSLLVLLAALLGVGLTFALGRWQLARAAEKQALHAAIEARQSLPALDGLTLAWPLAPDQA